jgi:pimeloyl-ACP methyl ester carboxylesterase
MPIADINSIKMFYEVHGEGYPVVFTHGFTATHHMWDPQITVISKKHKFIIYDVRGHGQSESPASIDQYSADIVVEDLYRLLLFLGVQQAVVGGLSMGGYISLRFYLRHPEMVKALILMDTGPGYRNASHREAWNQELEKTADRLETEGIKVFTETERREAPPEIMLQHDPKGLANMARKVVGQHDAFVIDNLGKINVPTLVVVGEKDTPYLPAARYMSKTINNSEHLIIPGAGHASNIENETCFNEAVIDFLRGRNLDSCEKSTQENMK